MKAFAILAAIVTARRLNTNTGRFVEEEMPNDNMNIGVRFVNINDNKNNDELFKYNEVERLGRRGYMVAATDDPKNYNGGHTKVVPGLEEVHGFLSTLGT